MKVLIGVALLGFVAVASAQQLTLRSIATTREVMSGLVVPSSNAVFKAASEAPRDPDGWADVRVQALMLAEAGNLLLIGGRVADRDAWARYTEALRSAAEAVVKAADARDAMALSDAGDRVYEACEQCHTKYMAQ